ncbi:MAG: flagellar basal body-associated FliL family protein [Pseudomonadales bacterium]|nr:flagellar basal body-associated FliL family protein [Pseudomonadales bacterium]
MPRGLKLRIVTLLFAVFLIGTGVQAEEEESGDEESVASSEPIGKVRYVPLRPTFVTNFGVVEFGRLKYVRVDVALKVADLGAQLKLQHHFPSLRNIMVMLLSRQNEGSIVSTDGREKISSDALAGMQSFLTKEEGLPLVEAVIFTNFVVQH